MAFLSTAARRLAGQVARWGLWAGLAFAALHWHWGIGEVWAGPTAFVVVRLVGMLARTTGNRWVVLGVEAA